MALVTPLSPEHDPETKNLLNSLMKPLDFAQILYSQCSADQQSQKHSSTSTKLLWLTKDA